MEDEKKGPLTKGHVGRFQISVWKKKKTLRAKNDFDVEREVEMVRACIQYGRFNRFTKTWANQSIWCNPEELRDLANVLDQLNGGDDASPKGGNRGIRV